MTIDSEIKRDLRRSSQEDKAAKFLGVSSRTVAANRSRSDSAAESVATSKSSTGDDAYNRAVSDGGKEKDGPDGEKHHRFKFSMGRSKKPITNDDDNNLARSGRGRSGSYGGGGEDKKKKKEHKAHIGYQSPAGYIPASKKQGDNKQAATKKKESSPKNKELAGTMFDCVSDMPHRRPSDLRRSRMERKMTRRIRRISQEEPNFLFQPTTQTRRTSKYGIARKHLGYVHQLGTGGSIHDSMEDSLSSVVLTSLSKQSLCDVKIIGKDDVPVQAPSYLIACHSEVFEEMFYSESTDETTAAIEGIVFSKVEGTCLSRVEIGFANCDAIRASIHFLATRALPDSLESEPNESNIRAVCQVHLFGLSFKIPSLTNQAYRAARRIMNKVPRLVCAAFDECIALSKVLPATNNVSSSLHASHDELKAYAFDYMRESPMTTLLAGGIVFLKAESIEAIICDQDMDVDEYTMFTVLNNWVKVDKENNTDTGKKLVSNIRLSYIKTDHLNNVVKRSGIVDLSDVDAALKEIEDIMANQKLDDKEHILVEGAGNTEINGIYVRMDEDIGLESEEVVYVKEAQEDDDCPTDFGLYLLKSKWAISSCVDYSNVLYSCEEKTAQSAPLRHQAPKSGWKAVNGSDPPPTCTWNPSKDNTNPTGKDGEGYVAPNLAGGRSFNKSLYDTANGDHDEGWVKRSLTSMLNLPTDQDFEDGDYHDIDESACVRRQSGTRRLSTQDSIAE